MPEIALAGNPNTGKTTIFNALTGATARVGNYPGITVERRSGSRQVGDAVWTVHDLPGCYSLLALSPEEEIAHRALVGALGSPRPDAVIVVLDAGSLARNLLLLMQICELGIPTVAALNLMDEANARGLSIDCEGLGAALGVRWVPMVARRGEGIDALERAVTAALQVPPQTRPRWQAPSPELATALATLRARGEAHGLPPMASDFEACWWLYSDADALEATHPDAGAALEAASGLSASARAALRSKETEDRFAHIDRLLAQHVGRLPQRQRSMTERIDSVLLNPVGGPLLFLLVMGALFQAVFAGVSPAVDAIDGAMAAVSSQVGEWLPASALRDVIVDGVLAGVAGTAVFVPQIAVLFFGIALLEDSGYLARAALMTDRLLGRAGLPGTAFVPLLSSFACNIPGIMAARAMPSPSDRLVTILIAPLMSCSARLPVYTLVTATVFADAAPVFGVLSLGGLLVLAMYGLGLGLALLAGALLRRTVARGPRSGLLLELPPYRLPAAHSVALVVWRRVRQFCLETGPLIEALTVVLWALMTWPRVELPAATQAALQADVAAALDAPGRQLAQARLDDAAGAHALSQSAAGMIGHALEPLIAPLGFDWRIGIGLVGSFAAREVLVPVLGRVYGRGGGDDLDQDVYQRQVGGSLVRVSQLTPLVGVSLMIFFAVAMQCMSTVAIMARETRSWRWPLAALLGLNGLAWVLAFAARQIGLAAGWS